MGISYREVEDTTFGSFDCWNDSVIAKWLFWRGYILMLPIINRAFMGHGGNGKGKWINWFSDR